MTNNTYREGRKRQRALKISILKKRLLAARRKCSGWSDPHWKLVKERQELERILKNALEHEEVCNGNYLYCDYGYIPDSLLETA